jgi:hypothetical protein
VTDVPCNRYINPRGSKPLLIFNPHHLPQLLFAYVSQAPLMPFVRLTLPL